MSGLKGPGSIRRRAAEAAVENDDEPTRGRPGAPRAAEPRRERAAPAATRREREPEPARAGRKGSDDLVVVLDDIDPKKNSVRFNATDKDAAVSSIYINNNGIPNRSYNRVRLTIEFLDD